MKANKLVTALRLILMTSSSNRALGRQLEIAYNTIRRYRGILIADGTTLDDIEKASEMELEARFNKRGYRSSSKRMPDFSYIHREMGRKGVTRTLLWMEYKEEDPDTAYELSRFNELYVEWAGKNALTMRQQYEPGERGFTDYSGTTMCWVDPATGEMHEAQIFVATAGVSGLIYGVATPTQRTEDWIEAHCAWYEFLGGVPKITVSDNLKAAVLKAGREPDLNPAYVDMAEHYGTVILPARSRRPKDKALVEGGVLVFLRWVIARLRKRVFHSLAELNAAIMECVDLINSRVMRRYQQSRQERFDAIDRPALLPLPVRYEYGEWAGPFRVPPDYHVCVKGHFYSVPYRLVQQQVYARCTANTIEFMHDNGRVASHARSEAVGQKTTDRAHMPEHHLAWADHTPERYMSWAQSVGIHSLTVISGLLEQARHPAAALNACASLQKLARTHSNERFELACAKAIEIKSPTVKSIRSILQHKLEHRSGTSNPQPRLPSHVNVRGAGYYQNQENPHVD
jgi:transposase